MARPPTILTRVLHPCVLVECGETRVLIDPCFGTFTHRPLTSTLLGVRMPEPGLRPEDLGSLSVMALTHGHEDHFDDVGIARLPSRETRVLVASKGLARRARRLGFRQVDVIRPWETASGGRWKITAVPARSPNAWREVSYVLGLGETRLLHAGDTAMHDRFGEIRDRCAPQVACLPVNGVSMLGVRLTMTPGEAAAAAGLLGLRTAIPIHAEMEFTRASRILYRASGTARGFTEELRRRSPGTRVVLAERGQPIHLSGSP
jgi:L-ascorbate metabolism protein UlaG (beta-lactamase superfamily)